MKKDISLNGQVLFSEKGFSMIAGPCAVENEKDLVTTAELLIKNNVKMMRGGAYKLRTSPYDFQGLGDEGLQILSRVAKAHNLFSVTEIISLKEMDLFEKYIDIIIIGTRNMYNYQLLKEIGTTKKPVILKRGMSATVKEWLLAAEYIRMGGNDNLVFCERGIRAFDNSLRYTFDLATAVHVNNKYGFHVITDPSHATGNADLITPLVLASLVTGIQGCMIEIHPNPSKALSDGDQMIDFDRFDNLMSRVEQLKAIKS